MAQADTPGPRAPGSQPPPDGTDGPTHPEAAPLRTNARFAMTPVDLLTDRTLYPIDRIIGALLAQHDGGGYCCWPTNAQLAAEAGCRERQVQLSLRRLEKSGWIAVEPSHQTDRGQVIRLLWRRPMTTVRRAHRGAGGGAPRCAPSF